MSTKCEKQNEIVIPGRQAKITKIMEEHGKSTCRNILRQKGERFMQDRIPGNYHPWLKKIKLVIQWGWMLKIKFNYNMKTYKTNYSIITIK